MAVGAALEVVGVSKQYGAHRALDDVYLLAEPGQLHGLLGPNGAGKTTLIRICLGLVRPDAGNVRLLGRPPRRPAIRRLKESPGSSRLRREPKGLIWTRVSVRQYDGQIVPTTDPQGRE